MINDNLQHVLSQTVQACNIKTSMSDSEGCDSVRVPSKNHNMWQFFHAVGMYHHLCLCFIDVFATIVADLCSDLQFPPPPNSSLHRKPLLAMQNDGIGTEVAMANMFLMHVLHSLQDLIKAMGTRLVDVLGNGSRWGQKQKHTQRIINPPEK